MLMAFCACPSSSEKVEPPIQNEFKELILQTEHCRYYCLSRNGFGNCKIVICECDSGYTGDASVSW